jgi:cytochrome o ubiquinol oxidase subunit IV
MKSEPHNSAKRHQPYHATATPYVIGFVLSLAFTLVPYYLVVKKSLSVNTLLATILVFAVLQMLVQLLFFLHLGREKKPRFNLLFLMSTVSIILLVVVGSLWIMSHLRHNMTGIAVTDKITTDEAVHQIDGMQAGTCPGGSGKNLRILLKDNTVTPANTDAHVCDTLIIINQDSTARNIDFGTGDKAQTYAGDSGESIRPGRSVMITLTQPGMYTFHDRVQSKMTGHFTVAP